MINKKKLFVYIVFQFLLTAAVMAQANPNGILVQSKVLIANDDNNKIYIGTDNSWPLILMGRADSSGLNIVPSTGFIGIGTANPQSKLSVNGDIMAKLVKVRTDWADYVFDSMYVLPNLHSVEEFIKKNKHLPGIPAGLDVETNGLDLGNMQKMQMEKIEELTLHIIQQEKKIEEQNKLLAKQQEMLLQLQQKMEALLKDKKN